MCLHRCLIAFVSSFFVLVYWTNCFLYAVACFDDECYEYGWFRYNMKLMTELGMVSNPEKFIFVRCLLYTLSIIFAMKQSSIVEWVTYEKFIMFLVLNVSYFMYAFCFSALCASLVINNQYRVNYKEYMRTVNMYLNRNRVDIDLCKRAANLLKFRWEYNENVKTFGMYLYLFVLKY